MSAKDGATIASKPKSWSAQGACSREEPQPKLRPVDQDRVRLQLDLPGSDPVVEEELSEAGPLDPLEELLGDDLVGVHVSPVEHRDPALDHVDRPHLQLQSLMSTKRPSIAAAAAIRGLTRWVRPPCPDAPRSFGSRSRHSARPRQGCRGSSRGTSSSPPRAIQSRQHGRSRRGPLPRPSPSPPGSRGRPSPAPSRRLVGRRPPRPPRAGPRPVSWCRSR